MRRKGRSFLFLRTVCMWCCDIPRGPRSQNTDLQTTLTYRCDREQRPSSCLYIFSFSYGYLSLAARFQTSLLYRIAETPPQTPHLTGLWFRLRLGVALFIEYADLLCFSSSVSRRDNDTLFCLCLNPCQDGRLGKQAIQEEEVEVEQQGERDPNSHTHTHTHTQSLQFPPLAFRLPF